MVHSIELLFDRDTEAAVRHIWEAVVASATPRQAPAGRPHVTLAVAESIAADADELLTAVSEQLPLSCLIGAPVVFGRTNSVVARLVVPTSELLDLHSQVHRLSGPYLAPTALANSLPGQWTAHVTVARRVDEAQLASTLHIAGHPAQIAGSFAGLRHWDGDKKVDRLLGG